MKSAELFVEALKEGLSPIETLQSLPEYEPHYIHTQHAYLNPEAEVVATPVWLLDRAFEPVDTVDPARPCPSCSSVRDAWSNAVLAEATHD